MWQSSDTLVDSQRTLYQMLVYLWGFCLHGKYKIQERDILQYINDDVDDNIKWQSNLMSTYEN